VRRMCFASIWLAAVLLAASAAGQEAGVGPRVRGVDEGARQVIQAGVEASTTVRELVATLERSDLIVMVSASPPDPWQRFSSLEFHGSTTFRCAAGGQRFVGIWLDSTWLPRQRLAHRLSLLAHELQHAVEIARAPDVVDAERMDALFARIGFELRTQHFETDDAVAVESRVEHEVADRARGGAKPR
jgi:hypothetical protein